MGQSPDIDVKDMSTSKTEVNANEEHKCVTQTHQMLPEDLLSVLRMVTWVSTLPTLRESSLTGLRKDCPAKAVEAHAIAAAMIANEGPPEDHFQNYRTAW
jgi:hypothetical protein